MNLCDESLQFRKDLIYAANPEFGTITDLLLDRNVDEMVVTATKSE